MKIKTSIIMAVFIICLFGCSRKSVVEEEKATVPNEKEMEQQDIAETVSENEWNKNEAEIFITNDAENNKFPIMSEEELARIEWDNDLIPYIEYNFLDENEFWSYTSIDSNIFVSFGDLDLDDQREMMITIPAYRGGSKTFIYTVENGEVIYCGWTIAGREYVDNSVEFKFWPQNLFDIYVNEKGDIRYFSGKSDEHVTFGNYSIYESSFENNQILCQPVFAMVRSGDNYGYWTKDTWEDWENYESDDENYTALNNVIIDYMSGYEKINVPFFYSEYAIPGYVRDLEEESQEAIRNNILAGMAQAMENKESFFFSHSAEVQRVNIVSTIPDLPDNMNLITRHIGSYPKGDLYELRLDYENEFSCRNYDGWDRRNLGYFYVEGNLIYRIKENEADEIWTWSEEELKNMGTIVCQESPLEDKLGVEARGFHEIIDIDGNSCMYKSYANNVETDFYEGFIWEKGKGLVNYYSGYGAQLFHLEINIDE